MCGGVWCFGFGDFLRNRHKCLLFLKEIPLSSEFKAHTEVLISLIQNQSLNETAVYTTREYRFGFESSFLSSFIKSYFQAFHHFLLRKVETTTKHRKGGLWRVQGYPPHRLLQSDRNLSAHGVAVFIQAQGLYPLRPATLLTTPCCSVTVVFLSRRLLQGLQQI